VGMCSARSAYCRDVLGEVGLVSGPVRRGRLCDGTCPSMSGRVERGFLSVGSCSERYGYCRDVFADVGLLSERFRGGRLSFGTCTTKSG